MRGPILSGGNGPRLRPLTYATLAAKMVVNVPTEPCHYAEPDEYRLGAYGTLPYDWTRKDG